MRLFMLTLMFYLGLISVTAQEWKSIKKNFVREYKGNEYQRLQALATLDGHQEPQIIKLLIRVLKVDKSAKIYRKVIDMLAKVNDEKSKKVIYESMRRVKQLHAKTGLVTVVGMYKSPQAVKALGKMLKYKNWEIRYAVILALSNIKEKNAIALLIDCVKNEYGRLQQAAIKGLEGLTQMQFKENDKLWQEWWEDNERRFEFSQVKAPQPQERIERFAEGSEVNYYKYRLISRRLIFIIDVSGSMRAPSGRIDKYGLPQTRLEAAKEELIKTINSLPKNTYFNVIAYDTRVRSWRKQLTPQRMKNHAINFIKELQPGSQTATYNALEKALIMRQANTIYLLTDGQPSIGKFIQKLEIIDEIANLNKGRRVKINTIGISVGQSPFLDRLADENQGRYLSVK